MSEWISVEERLPSNETRVLIMHGDVVATGVWSGLSWSAFSIDRPINIYREVTHWMPLPEPPQQ